MNSYFDVAKMFEVKINKSEELHQQIKTKNRIAPISYKYNRENNYYISKEEYDEITISRMIEFTKDIEITFFL